MLSSKSVIVLCFTFSFVIHFELIYVKGMRSVLRFSLTFSLFFFACVCTTVPVPLVEKTVFVPLFSFVKLYVGLFLDFCSFPHIDLVHILLDLYLSISFFFFLSSGQMFLISNSICLQLTFVY